MASAQQIIHLHAHAPVKPAAGQPCNGCGVCCLSEPCPLGMLLSRKRRGACHALRWNDALHLYRCGLLVAPAEVLTQALPAFAQTAAPRLAPLLQRLARRWIAAGIGCDCILQPHD
ncbi:MAG: hypothetical protein ACR2I0_00825 [Rhodoferax sp.]